MSAPQPHPLALITQGSLHGGLIARLQPAIAPEMVRVGQFVVVQGQHYRYFGLITDLSLGSRLPEILLDPPLPGETLLSEVLQGTSLYGQLTITPLLQLPLSQPSNLASPDQASSGSASASKASLSAVNRLPPHFSPVYAAQAADFAQVFGSEADAQHFAIGEPLALATPVCLDLGRWVTRSNGIFGKSGTGKSFLTRLLLAGVIRTGAAVNLVFDMHSEYGWEAASEEDTGPTVKGLKQLFPGQVQIYTLDPASTRRRGVRDAIPLQLSYRQVDVEDLALLKDELNLTDTSLENALILRQELGPTWLAQLLAMSNQAIQTFCEERLGHKASLLALQRKMIRLSQLAYLQPDVPSDVLGQLLASLAAGKHVIVEFGAQASVLSYMLASNLITRHIHAAYVQKAERYLYAKDPQDKPRQLLITIEEAHRFLAPKVAAQTIYGTIAREMRKYFVSLLIVDQRPSGIDSEVLSQLGTRITALLSDERDLQAVLTGVATGDRLKVILTHLAPKQQVLVVGHATPLPIVLRTRPYDTAFYAAVGQPDWSTAPPDTVHMGAIAAREDLGL